MEKSLTPKKSIMKTTINLKCLVVAVIVLIQLIVEMFTVNTYLDEIITVAMIVIIAVTLITGKINNYDLYTLVFLGFVIIIGLLANVLFSINPSIFSVMVDVLTQIKPFTIFIGIRYLLNEKEKQTVIYYLSPYALVFILIVFIFSIINQFADINMSSGVRYGIKIFKFIYTFNHQYTTSTILCFGLIICNNHIGSHTKKFFGAIGLIAIASALKTLSVVFPIVWISTYYYFGRYKRFNPILLIPASLLILLLGSYQINTYLLDTDSPRRVFIDYAIKDANDHFPLGSGFGTYGSSEAVKHYSKLYYEYGFNNRWGLSPDFHPFIHDNYWQSVLGQFGWFGFPVFILLYARIINSAYNVDVPAQVKAYQIAAFTAVMVFAIGSAAITSTQGLLFFFGLSLFSKPEKDTKKKRLKIQIKF